MIATVTDLWRHPIKSHGREALRQVALRAGATMPWDRHWAVTHDQTTYAGGAWAPCQNFMIGTRTPGLAGLWAELDETNARVSLRHKDLGEMAFHPDDPQEAAQFLAWVAPLTPANRAGARAVVTADRGMTDTDYPSVSLLNHASHRAVADRIGRPIEPERWRCNIWLEGLDPWQEFDLIGQKLRIGSTVLALRDPIERCLHTAANPETGLRDADTLGALRGGWGHQNFGVYAEVIESGAIAPGDKVERA
ncbi:MAG: MOSC domain-containing protein [Rhodobacteraceae bacterium]|nr:MOSC domain-containing protein [Paracoccaceae bacterium]